MNTAVSLAPAIDAVLAALAALLLALGTFAIQRLLGWLKLSQDEKVRAYLEDALQNGIAFARARVSSRAVGSIDVKSAVVAEAANYAIARVPDALKRFGIDQDGVRDLVQARLGRA